LVASRRAHSAGYGRARTDGAGSQILNGKEPRGFVGKETAGRIAEDGNGPRSRHIDIPGSHHASKSRGNGVEDGGSERILPAQRNSLVACQVADKFLADGVRRRGDR